MAKALTVWSEPTGTIVDKSESRPPAIVTAASGLTERDRRQIVGAFASESYEMVAGFVLNKALAQLKKKLSSLGMEFVGEMLGRQDLDEDSIPTVSISNFEAIRLAQELGMINSTDAKRLSQHTELLAHFDNLDQAASPDEEMTKDEAVGFLRTCVNSILGRTDDVAPKEFVNFRTSLETKTYKKDDKDIETLKTAPYFFKRTTLSILLAGAKTRGGASYEHTLGNIVVIVPVIWPQLREAEKWSVGQAYAEAVNVGDSAAVTALKKALMAVQGFDFVPETLRSQTFSAAASAVLKVHGEANNYYNEPAAITALVKLGSTIPWPAFPICMSAIFAVYLGNSYGHTWAAQDDVEHLLKRLSANQWQYYLGECLPNDQLVLQKLAWHKLPLKRFIELDDDFGLSTMSVKGKQSSKILRALKQKDFEKIAAAAEAMLQANRSKQ